MIAKHALLKFLVFAAVCAAFTVWVLIPIQNPHLERSRSFEAIFTDASGLATNDSVKIAGVDVGKVTSIKIERGQAVVGFKVRNGVRLGNDSQVAIRWRNLLGLRYVYLYPAGDGDLEPGHRFPVERTVVAADFGTLLARLTPVLRSLDPEASNIVVRSLSEAITGRQAQIQRLVNEAGSVTQTLADRDVQVSRILQNSATVTDAYARRQAALAELIENFRKVSETVAARNDVIESTITEVADVQAQLGKQLDENDPNIRATVAKLDEITQILNRNHENVEDIVAGLGRALAFYHRTSRWGQWFNVRVVGFSKAETPILSERDAHLPNPKGITNLFKLGPDPDTASPPPPSAVPGGGGR